jgi:hypothetical protein
MTRTAALALLILAPAALAQPGEAYTSAEGRFRVKFPGKPKVSTSTVKSAVGELKVTVAVYATADGNAYVASFTDFPAAAAKAENRDTLFGGVRDKVKEGGELKDEKTIEFGPDKLPGRELVVDRDKGKQRIKYRAILRDARLYQVGVIGTADFATGKDATAFLESLELTK